jgi:predicted Fe-Mo cluster-binding NifX family protein
MTQQMLVSRPGLRIAVTVMDFGSGPTPCPFFGKCDGIAVVDMETGVRLLQMNPPRTPETLCGLILASDVNGLVCGYIAEAEAERLRTAGIDVRLGSCQCSIDELVACFCDLPEAQSRA